MDVSDSYRTISKPGEGLYKEKGSKFIGKVVLVENEERIKEALETIRKQHHGARHHCYAWCMGVNRADFRINDDGEPSGTAGRPIYNQILSADLTNVLLVVTRYYGGTKLGASGLANAYKTASREAIANAKISRRTINDYFLLEYDYPDTNDAMKLLHDDNIEQLQQDFDMKCKITFRIRKSKSEKVVEQIRKNNKLKLSYLKTE